MAINLSQYRKIIALVVTGAVVYGLQLVGLGVHDLAQFGFSLGGISEPIVDFLVSIGIPAVIAMAQPNEDGDTIRRHWHWILLGLLVLAVLIAIVITIGQVIG